MTPIVKSCPKCRCPFSIDCLIADPTVQPIGMTFDGRELEFSLYYFNHVCAGCNTTFAVPVETFVNQIDDRTPRPLLVGSETCDGHCVQVKDLTVCNQPCANAPYRRFLVEVLLNRGRPAKASAA